MKRTVARIYGRYGQMPEVFLEEMVITDHPRARLDRLQEAYGERWALTLVKVPKVNPALRRRVDQPRPARPRTQLFANEGITSEANKQPFNPKGPAAYAAAAAA